MTSADQFRQMKAVAQLIRERDLSRLRQVSLQKGQIEAMLGALDNTQSSTGLDPIRAAQVVDRYGLWTANRRILLNQHLARTTADWLCAKADAQKSFGRAAVLEQLTSKR